MCAMGESARERRVFQEKKGELSTLGLNFSNSPFSLPYFQGTGSAPVAGQAGEERLLDACQAERLFPTQPT